MPWNPSAVPATAVGMCVTLLAIAAMAVDHLLGDDPGLEDPVTFVISVVLSVTLAVLLFGWLVPRMVAHPTGPILAATRGLWCSVAALLGVPLTMWLGLPFVTAGAGLVLGLRGRGSERRSRATTAVVLAVAVLLFGTVGYFAQAVRKL